MKSKILTSVLSGLIIPWAYFLIFQVGSIRTYTAGGDEIIGSSGVQGFIQFHGIQDSLVLYGKSAAICALAAFAVCLANEVIGRVLNAKP